MSKQTVIKILRYLFFLALAVVLMYFAFKAIDFNKFVEGLKSADYLLVAISVVVGIIGYVFRVLRWQILISSLGYNIQAKNVYHATMIGYLANFTIPRIGEVIRCTVLKKTDSIDFEKTFGTVIVERCYDLMFLLGFLALIITVRFREFGELMQKIYQLSAMEKITTIPLFAIIIAVVVLIILIVAVFYIRKKISKFVKGLISGLKTGIKMKNRKKFLFYTFLIYICYWFTGFLVLKAVPVTAELNAIDALFLFVIGAFGWVIPAQGGFGSYHILVASGLSVCNIMYDDGMLVAVISHESQVIFMILLGFISLAMLFRVLKNKNNKTSLTKN